MKRGYYISFGDRTSVGVDSKIEMQVRELRKYFDVKFIKEPKKKRRLTERILNFLPWVDNKWDYDSLFIKLDKPDFLYIRRIEAGINYINFLKKIRLAFPKCKILIEVPTYPYDKEYFGTINVLFLLKDFFYRSKLKHYTDRIVTYSIDDEIWGIPTIRTQNGVDVSRSPVIVQREYSENEIHLIAVALFQRHHGYERVIKGIGNYYKKSMELTGGGLRNIVFHIVGDGPERRMYEQLVHKLHIENNVIFHGMMDGEKQNRIFSQCDIALSVFGLYKQNSNFTSPIKTAEYLSRGVPIISGCPEAAFERKTVNFFMCFSNDAKSIDIQKVVEFYDKLFYPHGNNYLRKEIRKYAENSVDISVTMEPIIKYLIGGNV